MSPQPKIAVVTCVLNEEKHAERWAATTEAADYALWLDTGSTDKTVEYARADGIEVEEAVITPFRFDDARNIAMSLVPNDIDIVLQLDADETLNDNWRDGIDANPDHTRWSYPLISTGSSWGQVTRSNCVRRSAGYRWQHPIHEIIAGPKATCHLDDLIVKHQPDRTKSRDYILDSLKHWAKAEPDNQRLAFYLGREHIYRNDWNSARDVLWRYLSKPGWAPERSEAFLLLAQIDTDPERWLWKAVAEAPRRREPFYFLARHAYDQRNFDTAIAMVAEAMKRTDRTIYTTRAEAWDEPFNEFCDEVRQINADIHHYHELDVETAIYTERLSK
jgi:glycosyltransferase involved in cell wall biosynthesis